MKLRAKLSLLLLPSIALPLIVFGSIAHVEQRKSVVEESLRQLDTLVDQIARHVEARVEAARADMILFSNSRILKDYLLVEDEAQRYQLFQPGLLKLFASYQRANPEYEEIRVLLPDGYEDTRSTLTDIPNLTEDEGETGYFRVLARAEEDLVTQLVPAADDGEPALLLSHRIELVDGSIDPILAQPKLRGYLVVAMSLAFLREHVREAQIGHGGHIEVLAGDGRVLFCSDIDHPHGPDPAPFFDDLFASAEAESIRRVEHLDGMDLARGKKVHESIYLYAGLPEAELLASTRQIALVALLLTAGSIVLTAAILYSVLRSLVLGPLEQLGEATRQIGSGNLVTNVGIRRRDEIGALAASFEEMGRNLQQSHEQIAYLAYHDSLTGLPNRRMFFEELERSVVYAARHGNVVGLLFVDIDDFKRVNDVLGHQAGDDLLREIARRLSGVVRPYDTVSRGESREPRNAVARVGGDEFLILLPDLGEPLQAAGVAKRILEKLAAPIRVDAQAVHVKASVGITTYPQDGDTAEELIRNADIAMYHAKEGGKNLHRFYTAEMNTVMARRMEMENALRRALAGDELMLHYQPQVDAASGRIVATEALVRWRSPELGMVMPGIFIPLAEDSGLIGALGDWVLREACRQNKAWQDAGLPAVPVAVNISNRQFSEEGLERKVERVLADTGLAPRYLDLELTETSIMMEPDKAAATLVALKELGVTISMDDFGTGYSSLSALKRLPIDCLKIDQSFVRDIGPAGDDAAIVSTIIVMSKSLNLLVVAEGVEEEDQLAFLCEHGCDRIQGYLMSRPVPAPEMEALLAARQSLPVPAEKPDPARDPG
jgi:diguanylate cyclase (GGDEF)-like protein